MLYREIIAVCSQIHKQHINKMCGQNVELLNVKLAVHIVAVGLCTVTKNKEGRSFSSLHFIATRRYMFFDY